MKNKHSKRIIEETIEIMFPDDVHCKIQLIGGIDPPFSDCIQFKALWQET